MHLPSLIKCLGLGYAYHQEDIRSFVALAPPQLVRHGWMAFFPFSALKLCASSIYSTLQQCEWRSTLASTNL
jgi:hypothetical protein